VVTIACDCVKLPERQRSESEGLGGRIFWSTFLVFCSTLLSSPGYLLLFHNVQKG
jgi:hypothetical protein